MPCPSSADEAFSCYVAALADDEADAAEIYANWCEDTEFLQLVTAFDFVWSMFLDDKISIEYEDEPPNSIMEE